MSHTRGALRLGGLVSCLALILVAGPAQAHDELIATIPAAHARVQTVFVPSTVIQAVPAEAAAKTADPTSSPTSSQQSTGSRSTSPRWVGGLVLLLLLVPVAVFIRRRPGGPHDASPKR